LVRPAGAASTADLITGRKNLSAIGTLVERTSNGSLRNEVCNRSDDGNPPLELSGQTETLASRDWLSPMKWRAKPAFLLR
jgi:hypothetical protein